MRLVVRQGMTLVAIGVAIGAAIGSAWEARDRNQEANK